MNHILSAKFIHPLKLGPIFASSYSNRVTHNFIFNIISTLHLEWKLVYGVALWKCEQYIHI